MIHPRRPFRNGHSYGPKTNNHWLTPEIHEIEVLRHSLDE